MKDIPVCKRRHAGAVHARQGPTLCYETALVELLGVDWRDLRDHCQTVHEWHKLCDGYVSELSAKWSVPRLPSKSRKASTISLSMPRVEGMPVCLAAVFTEKAHPQDDKWEKGAKCFQFISDSQVSVDIFNGKVPLADDNYLPLFTRVSRRVAQLLELDYQPPQVWEDPFQWRPREFNTQADALCNFVQDTDSDFTHVAPDLREIQSMQPMYLVYTDGGCRDNGTSAFAWVIYGCVWDGSAWVKLVLAKCGRKLSHDAHSFATETLAIDGASEMLLHMILNT